MPAKRAVKQLVDVVAAGDRLDSLKAIRDRLASEMSGAEGAQLAAVAKQLVAVVELIEAGSVPEVSASAEIEVSRAQLREAALGNAARVGGKRRGAGSGAGGRGRAAS